MYRFILPVILIISVAMVPVKKKHIVFFGDSITQMGVNEGGYIDLIQKKINANGTADKYQLAGAGVGGNKVYDLYLRMEDDVMAKKPNIVMIYVGINDVWHKTSGIGTDIVKYERFYVAIIKKLQAKKIQVAVCTPTVIGELKDNGNPQDSDLNAYSEVIRKLSVTMSCPLIDLRKTFQQYEQANNTSNQEKGVLTVDRVHLTAKGNQLVADEIMKVLAIQ